MSDNQSRERHVPAVVMITGASAGFGEATAQRFSATGSRLVLLARRRPLLEKLAVSLETEVHIATLDVRDVAQVEKTIAELPEQYRAVDVLVNSAGLALGLDPLFRAESDDLETMMATNTRGLVAMTQAVLPGMVERDRGHVVNLGSTAGSYPYAGAAVYGGTKAFVEQFSLALRADLLGTQVRVTNIEPGLAKTEFSQVRFKGDPHAAESPYVGTEPLLAADIAEAVVWAVTQPPHVNINRIEIMPTCQAPAGLAVHRR